MPKTAQSGDLVDRSYRLIEPLGEGAMGTVFKALQLINNQIVALKLVSQQLVAEDPDGDNIAYRLALAREFQTLASLHHPNVIRVLSYGFDAELGSYFTMELLDSAQNLLEAGRHQTEEFKVRMIAQLLRALSYIHRRSVIHRDIKPGNVLFVDGEVKLLDFGIATESGQATRLAGTMEYISPELLLGEPPSVESDLYAAGVVFHLLLTDAFPYGRASRTAILEDLLGADSDQTLSPDAAILFDGHSIPPSGVRASPLPSATEAASSQDAAMAAPGAQDFTNRGPTAREGLETLDLRIKGPLGEIIGRLLARKPEDRYASAGATLRDLGSAVHYELLIETAATRESFLQATALIGRQVELLRLTEALDRAKDRGGTAFLLGGESGVGKSRLLSELHTSALVRGAWVVEGQSQKEGGAPYQEWLPLLRALCFRTSITDVEAALLKDLIPDIQTLLGRPIAEAPGVSPESALARLSQLIIRILERLDQPLLFSLEDLHWGRSESIALLSAVSPAISHLPVLFVATYRSDERPGLSQSLVAFQVISLQRLGRDDIGQVTESMLGPIGKRPELVGYLTRHTEGNSFFLVEVVRALAENAGELERIGQGELPEGVLTAGMGRIIERRVAQVAASYQPALEFSAVLGRKLDLAALQHAFPELPLRDFLMECANAAVLESQGSEWRFAHDKLREAILTRLAIGQLQKLHQQAATTLEHLYDGIAREPFFAALAIHHQKAEVYNKAIHYNLLAGERAARLYAYEQARLCYGTAAMLIQRIPDTSEHKRMHVDILSKEVEYSHYRVYLAQSP